MNGRREVRYASNTTKHTMSHVRTDGTAAAREAAEGRATMTRTTGSLRPDTFDRTLCGDAAYGFVTTMLDERYAEAARARMASTQGSPLRTRVGRRIVSLGQAIGGRALVPPAPDARPATAIAAVGRRGTAEGC
jgi:hypothetical protein